MNDPSSTDVTVIIPARNESIDIARCLEHVLVQDHRHDRLQVVVVDGASSDRTAAIAADVLTGADVRWEIVRNELGTTPSNLNAGLASAIGEVICRVDARSFIPVDYVRRCVELLVSRPDLVVVGGAQIAQASGSSAVERGISRALNNRYVMGGARYRAGALSGPDDTVYLGAFRTEQLREVGGWNERLTTNQDFDLNRRMGQLGIVWFEATIPVEYRPRGQVSDIARQYHRFGRAKVVYWYTEGDGPLPRQRLLLGGAAASAATVAALVLASSSRVRASMLLCALGAGAAAVVDVAGSQTRAPVVERVVATGASGAVGLGWLSGVAREFAAQSTRGRWR